MNQEAVDNLRAVIAARQKAIMESENPKQAAINHLKEMGFLNPDGTLAERFGGPETLSYTPLCSEPGFVDGVV